MCQRQVRRHGGKYGYPVVASRAASRSLFGGSIGPVSHDMMGVADRAPQSDPTNHAKLLPRIFGATTNHFSSVFPCLSMPSAFLSVPLASTSRLGLWRIKCHTDPRQLTPLAQIASRKAKSQLGLCYLVWAFKTYDSYQETDYLRKRSLCVRYFDGSCALHPMRQSSRLTPMEHSAPSASININPAPPTQTRRSMMNLTP